MAGEGDVKYQQTMGDRPRAPASKAGRNGGGSSAMDLWDSVCLLLSASAPARTCLRCAATSATAAWHARAWHRWRLPLPMHTLHHLGGIMACHHEGQALL